MKKSHFFNLLLGVVGGLMFSIGMCMCLVEEWSTYFNEGVIVTAIGAVVLLVQGLVNYIRCRKPGTGRKINWKLIGKIVYGFLGTLILGVGMCLIMVWNMMLYGIIVGVVGIVWLLCLIPMIVGLK